MTGPGGDADSTGQASLWLLALLTLAAGALRVYHLGEKSLWFDEAVLYHLVQGGWQDIVRANAHGNSAPPLYALLLGLITAADASEGELRILSAVAGIAGVVLTWLLARQFVAPRYALLAALLATLSPTLVEYSQQLREYSLAYALAAALLWAYVRFTSAPNPRRMAAAMLLVCVCLLTQYGLALLAAALALSCMILFLTTAGGHPAAYRRWLSVQVAGAVVAVIVYVVALRHQIAGVNRFARDGGSYLADRYWDGSLAGLMQLVADQRSDIIHFAYPGKVMLALVALGLLAALLRRNLPLLLVTTAPIVVTVAAAMMRLYPFGAVRQDIFLLPMIYVIAAFGVQELARALERTTRRPRVAPWLIGGLAVVLAAQGLWRTGVWLNAPGQEQMRLVADELKKQTRPGDRIFVDDAAVPAFRYYWRARPEPWTAGPRHWPEHEPQARAGLLRQAGDAVVASLEVSGSLWLVMAHLPDENRDLLLDSLATRASVETVLLANGAWLYRLRTAGGSPRESAPVTPEPPAEG